MNQPHSPPPVDARLVTPAELPTAVQTLARAFYADPVWSWAFPDSQGRLEQIRSIWRLVAEAAVEYGSAWRVEECAAVGGSSKSQETLRW